MVSKFINYFEIDVKYELNETIKVGSEIDYSNLLKMGFLKHNDAWIRKTGEASSSESLESSNAASESQANEMNALIAYVPLVGRGEPLSNFERVMLNRLDTISGEQRAYYEMTLSRFQHLDHQIKVVQEQLVELYHRDQ